MSTLTLTVKKPRSRHLRRAAIARAKPWQHAITEAWQASIAARPKPSKRAIREAWARSSGIVNTGETDLSTREGLGF